MALTPVRVANSSSENLYNGLAALTVFITETGKVEGNIAVESENKVSMLNALLTATNASPNL